MPIGVSFLYVRLAWSFQLQHSFYICFYVCVFYPNYLFIHDGLLCLLLYLKEMEKMFKYHLLFLDLNVERGRTTFYLVERVCRM